MRTALATLLATILMMMTASSCHPRHTAEESQGDTLSLSHATLLTIVERHDGTTLVRVADPWKEGRTLHLYALVPRTADIPADLPEGCTVVRTPVQKAVVFTAVHLALISEFGCLGQVCGVCDAQYMHQPEAKTLQNFGSSMQPSIEALASAAPDALLVSPFENGGYGQMEKLGLPIIECADYMETSPLARAEWMRFYGLLFGVDAEPVFAKVKSDYQQLCREPVGRTMFTDQLSGQAWYVPGGRSYLGTLFADAGACYLFADSEERGSVALSFETVFSRANEADVWLIKYGASADLTLNQLAQNYAPYRQFRAFREGNVYGCNTEHVNYYEETCFHPERLLRDIEAVLDGGEGTYYTRLK